MNNGYICILSSLVFSINDNEIKVNLIFLTLSLILLFQVFFILARKDSIKKMKKLMSKDRSEELKDLENTEDLKLNEIKTIQANLNEELMVKQDLIDSLIIEEKQLSKQVDLTNKEKYQVERAKNNTNINMPSMNDEVILPSFLSDEPKKYSLQNQTYLVRDFIKLSNDISNLDYNIGISKRQIARFKEMDSLKNNMRINFTPSNKQKPNFTKEKYFNFVLEENEIYFIQRNLIKLKDYLLSIDNTKLIGNQDDIYICLHDKLSSFKNYSIEHKKFGILGYIPQDIIDDLSPLLSFSMGLEADWMVSKTKEKKDILSIYKIRQSILQVEIELRVYWEDNNG